MSAIGSDENCAFILKHDRRHLPVRGSGATFSKMLPPEKRTKNERRKSLVAVHSRTEPANFIRQGRALAIRRIFAVCASHVGHFIAVRSADVEILLVRQDCDLYEVTLTSHR